MTGDLSSVLGCPVLLLVLSTGGGWAQAHCSKEEEYVPGRTVHTSVSGKGRRQLPHGFQPSKNWRNQLPRPLPWFLLCLVDPQGHWYFQ